MLGIANASWLFPSLKQHFSKRLSSCRTATLWSTGSSQFPLIPPGIYLVGGWYRLFCLTSLPVLLPRQGLPGSHLLPSYSGC